MVNTEDTRARQLARFAELANEMQVLLDTGLDPASVANSLPPALAGRLYYQWALQHFTGAYAIGYAICQLPSDQLGVGDATAKAALVELWARSLLRVHRTLSYPLEHVDARFQSEFIDEVEVLWLQLKGGMAAIVDAGNKSTIMSVLCRDEATIAIITSALQQGHALLRQCAGIKHSNWNGSPQDQTPTPDLYRAFVDLANTMHRRMATTPHP